METSRDVKDISFKLLLYIVSRKHVMFFYLNGLFHTKEVQEKCDDYMLHILNRFPFIEYCSKTIFGPEIMRHPGIGNMFLELY